MIILGYFFLFLHKNLYCGYSLEVPQQGTSIEYPQSMLLFLQRTGENYSIVITKYSSLLCFSLSSLLIALATFFFLSLGYDTKKTHKGLTRTLTNKQIWIYMFKDSEKGFCNYICIIVSIAFVSGQQRL